MTEMDETESLVKRLLIVVAVIVAFYAVRAPFLTQPLLGEEGMFADLLAHAPAGPRYALLGRVHGEDIRDIYQHPALMYEVYNHVGSLMRHLAAKGFQPHGVWARLVHSLFQALLIGLLAWRAGRAKGGASLVVLGFGLVALSAPLGLSNSVHLQTDTSSGTLFAGLLALVLAGAEAWWAGPLAALALSSVGKQEWFIGAGAGLVGAEILATLCWGKDKASLRTTALCLGALLLGQGVAWAFDPINYIGGWGVLTRLSGHRLGAAGQAPAWDANWPLRLIFLPALALFLLLSLGLALSSSLERRRAELRASLVAWALFVPFALSTWNPSPRYFAPAWAAALGALTVQLTGRERSWRSGLAWLVVCVLLAYGQLSVLGRFGQAHISVTEDVFFNYDAVTGGQDLAASQVKGGCVPRLSSAYAWDKPIDFIGEGLALGDGEQMAKEKGAKPCPPPKAPR